MDIVADAVKIIGTAVAALIGGTILGRSMERYKKRTVYLKKRLNVQHVALAGQSGSGKIRVLYNETPCNSLYVASLELVNESRQDLDGFTVHFSVAVGETIYQSSGKFTQGEASKDVLIEENYGKVHYETYREAEANNFDATLAGSPGLHTRVDYILRNVIFSVPFLNRKEKVSFSFLIDSINTTLPNLVISFGRGGLEVVTEEDKERRRKIREIWVGVSSTVLFILPLPSIIRFSTSIAWAVWLTVIDSVIAYLLAWVIYYAWVWFKKKR